MGAPKKIEIKALKWGDIIEVVFKKTPLHGEFLRYESAEKVFVLKLKSGYDIAIDARDVSSLRLIERGEKNRPLEKVIANKVDFTGADLAIITTGGTISSKVDYRTGGVSPSVPSDYYFQIAPGLKRFGKIAINDVMHVLSEDMRPADWLTIAKTASRAISAGVKGVIVTMGTDTMHFASSAVSFLLNPLSVPVVFTGAQRSPDRGSSDASTNLMLSATAASRWNGGESVICMHATMNDDYNFILRGNRARKMHTERRDAFRPINTVPLAKVHLDGKIEELGRHIPKSRETSFNPKLDDNVALMMSYPGMSGEAIKSNLNTGAHGIVIAGTGFGNLPLNDKGVAKALLDAEKRDVPVVITSQTVYGATNRFVYSTLREMSRFRNIIYVEDMTTETAFVKLMFVLGKTKDIDEINEMMTRPLARESGGPHRFDAFLV